MCLVFASCFRRSRMVQPSRSGKRMSRVMAAGLNLYARASAACPVVATRPLNPFSRARSKRIFAKLTSSSTINTDRSPSSIALRSSAIAAVSPPFKPSMFRSTLSAGVHAACISEIALGALALAGLALLRVGM